MHYQRFDPSGCDFPKPRVPMLPPFSRHTLGFGPASAQKSATAGANLRFFSRARYALLQAYRECGVGPGGALLAPAYHCRTMLDPAIRLGAQIALYPLHPDLSPDLQALGACLNACQQPVKALLLPHYFGFAQKIEPIAHFCAEQGVTLIEDCSHTLWPSAADTQDGKVGTQGRFCVASPYKFFPCEDGGVLWGNTTQSLLSPKQRRPALSHEIRGWLRASQHARANQPRPDATTLSDQIKALMDNPMPSGHDGQVRDEHTSRQYVDADAQYQSLAGSRWIMRHANKARLIDRRRLHYKQWVSATAGLPHCRALLPELPPDVVPYMFPLYIERPKAHFSLLKMLGLPVWRWDDLAVSACPVATDLRLKLLHLPCHQELTTEQMFWITSSVQLVMRQL